MQRSSASALAVASVLLFDPAPANAQFQPAISRSYDAGRPSHALTSLGAPEAQGPSVVLHVDDDADPGGDGLTWATAFRFLQDAVATTGSVATAEIRIAQGIYTPDRDESGNVMPGDVDAAFVLAPATQLLGGYAGVTGPDPDARDIAAFESILSGDLNGDDETDFVNYDDNSRSIVVVEDVVDEILIEGLTITGANMITDEAITFSGGAIRVVDGALTLRHTTFSGNRALGLVTFAGSGAGVGAIGDSVLHVSECAFTGNHADGGGGGIAQLGGELVVEDSAFTGNTCVGSAPDEPCQVQGGGAIVCLYPDVDSSITGSTFTENSSVFFGGAITLWALGEDSITVRDCEFDGNSCAIGGAMCLGGGPLEVIDCTFEGNRARGPWPWMPFDSCTFHPFGSQEEHGFGGAVYCQNDAWIEDCSFIDNDAVFGGALDVLQSDPFVKDCTFFANSAEGGAAVGTLACGGVIFNCQFDENAALQEGGACYDEGSDTTYVNCTFVSNSSLVAGGGIRKTALGVVRIDNSILWGNSDANGVGESSQIKSDEGPEWGVEVQYSCVQGLTGALGGEGNIGDDPQFIEPGGARLSSTSPCIDAADNTLVPRDYTTPDDERYQFDLDGGPRFVNHLGTPDTGNGDFGIPAIVDMGPYEYRTDCNANGIDDETDILDGTSFDRNFNDLPDECETILGDVNFDGVVDTTDLLLMFASWGACPAPPGLCLGDLNYDGVVDAVDLLILLGAWSP